MTTDDAYSRFFSQIECTKQNLKIGIYGAYFPHSEKDRLTKFKDSLRSDGFVTCSLVEDMPDNPSFHQDNFLKSIFALQTSHINLFVLTYRGLAQGPMRELDYIIQNPQHSYKCVVLPETRYSSTGTEVHCCLTSLLRPDLETLGIKISQFKEDSDEDLLTAAKGPIVQLHYYYIKNRFSDLTPREYP